MNYFSRLFFLIITLILAIFMVINPRETVAAAATGFQLWFAIIVPALLPFFIIAELLVSLGFVKFLGILLEPIMRPVFGLPGCSSLVVAMGFTSGFPVGAILTRKLYDDKMLTAEESERLVSFTNNSSPLFILGAVGVGMLGSQALGYLLAVSHYLANLMVGVIWGIRAGKSKAFPVKTKAGLLSRAFSSLGEHNRNKRPDAGKILADAIKNSLNNILAIAGFIILFSVLTRMLSVWGVMHGIALFIAWTGKMFNISYQLAYGLGMGLFEITIGTKSLALVQSATVLQKVLAVSAVLAFSGFCIIAQIMGVMAGTPIRLSFYLLSRALQIILSVIISLGGYHLLAIKTHPVPSFAGALPPVMYSFDAWSFSLTCFALGLGFIGIMMFLALLRH